MSIFDYTQDQAIGSVFSVDTGTVVVRVSNEDALRKLQVNHLVALRSARAGQHLVGLITKITRRSVEGPVDTDVGDDVPEGLAIVENVIRVTLIGTLIDMVGAKPNVFRRTLETVPEIDAACFVLEGPRLTKFMQSISQSADQAQHPLSLGTYTIDEHADAWLDGNKLFQRHAVIVGSTGSGKSWTVARILEQVAQLPNANAILFDIHGEYRPLAGPGIRHLRVAGPNDLTAGAVDESVIFLPYWLLTYEEMLAMLLDRSDQNAPNQAMVFAREVTAAKRRRLEQENRQGVLANFTVDSPVPYLLDEVMNTLRELDTEMVPGTKTGEKQGPFHGKLTRFIQRLEAKRDDRRLGFLFGGGEATMVYDWMTAFCGALLGSTAQREGQDGVKVIDFSEVPSDILPLMLGLVGRVVFSVQQWIDEDKRCPVALFCDEAHLYIPERTESNAVHEAGLRAFERIAKEGRKYGVGLVVISQRPAEVNRTVLSQCNNFIAMRLSNAEDQSVVRRLLPDSLGSFSELLPILDVGEALTVGDACILPSRIRVAEPTTKPSSATVDFWDEWAGAATPDGIGLAVEALRRQSRASGNELDVQPGAGALGGLV